MATIQESISVNASRAAVDHVLTNPEYIQQWFEGLDTLEVTPDFPNAGSQQMWSYKVMGVEFKGTNTMQEYVPQSHATLTIDGLITGTQTIRQSGQDGNVTVEIHFDYEMSGGMLGKLAQPVVHGVNVNNIKGSLQKIKQLSESI